MKSTISIAFLIFAFLFTTTDVEAQKKRRRDRDKESTEESVRLNDRLNYEIGFGNITLGSDFGVSLKPSVGYKLGERFTAGISGRMFYNFINQNFGAPDLSLLSYGGGPFLRGKVTDKIYLQGEYSYLSHEIGYTNGQSERVDLNYPLLGGGYLSGYGSWRFGIEVLFILDNEARDFQGQTVEYWFKGSYNF